MCGGEVDRISGMRLPWWVKWSHGRSSWCPSVWEHWYEAKVLWMHCAQHYHAQFHLGRAPASAAATDIQSARTAMSGSFLEVFLLVLNAHVSLHGQFICFKCSNALSDTVSRWHLGAIFVRAAWFVPAQTRFLSGIASFPLIMRSDVTTVQ